jgi:hypothetical protein
MGRMVGIKGGKAADIRRFYPENPVHPVIFFSVISVASVFYFGV